MTLRKAYRIMSMRSKYEVEEPVPRSKCVTCLCVSWKVFSCVFSHVTLIAVVVAYCVFGAVLFEKLESEHEEKVSRNIVNYYLGIKGGLLGVISQLCGKERSQEVIDPQTSSK